jgi:5-methylcytosine-specific restriction endonuclease McrA
VSYCSDKCRKQAGRKSSISSYHALKPPPSTRICFASCDDCGRYHTRRLASTWTAFVTAGGILRCYQCAGAHRKRDRLRLEKERRRKWKEAKDPRYEKLCERENQKCHRRRVVIKSAPSDLTTAQVLAMKRAAKCCAICGGDLPQKVTSRPLDHIIPVNKHAGGTHTRDNVRVLCVSCNSSRPKDGSDVSEFQMNLWMGRNDS